MNYDSLGTVAARAVGVTLILVALTSALQMIPFHGGSAGEFHAAAGTMSGAESGPDDTYYVTSSSVMVSWILLPLAAQFLAGVAFLWGSRFLGKWLVRGLAPEGSPQ